MTIGRPGPAVGVLALVCALALPASGCGATSPDTEAPVSQQTTACRAQWGELADLVRDRDDRTNPSDLADRWTSVIATVDHYEHSARAADCGEPLTAQRQAIDRIEALTVRLRPYDIAYQASSLAPAGTDYLLNPLPPARGAGKKRERPPTRRAVQAALTTLQQQAPASVTDMQAGWTEAVSVDLDDDAAVRRTVADLKFLSADSAPFQDCLAAMAVLRRAASFRVG